MKKNLGFTLYEPSVNKLANQNSHGMTTSSGDKAKRSSGFTLIELLVVISIIALLSSVVAASVMKARLRARDSQRLQTARQIAIALEQYEATFNTYRVANSGDSNNGTGFVSKVGGSYTNSILGTLKSAGLYSSNYAGDPVFSENYYVGLCTSTNAYNIFVKLEQPEYNSATSSIVNACGGIEAASFGFSAVGATVGANTSGGSGGSNAVYSGASDTIVDAAGFTYKMVVGEDGKVWLDRNLGATRVATAYNDALAYGDLYQFGRGRDGHQIRTSPVVLSSSTLDMPGNMFLRLLSSTSTPWDWHVTQESYYWIGTDGGPNNPCPSGFRVPTIVELYALVAAIPNFNTASCGGTSACSTTAFNNSALKLPSSGWRDKANGNLTNVGANGLYWSSTIHTTVPYAKGLYWSPTQVAASTYNQYRANAFAIRCIKS